MPATLTYLGHSGFLINAGEHSLAVDPFLTGNPVAVHKPDDIRCKSIAITHGHEDHVGDAVAIAKANDATVYAAYEITEYLGENGITSCQPGNPGGRIAAPFGFVAFTRAYHSSSYQGRYMGNPCGLILNIGGVTIYHCGDTDLFSDMRLIGEIYKPDVALVPIGDRFTMGPALATRAAELIGARLAIPIHYNTWPPIVQNPADFRPIGVDVHPLQPGQTLEI